MNICVIGNNLTSLVLSKALVNKKINVTIFYNYEKKIFKSNRSIGITRKNIDFLKNNILKIDKKYFNPIKQIEIYTEKNKKKKILNFNEKDKYLFHLIKADTLYKLSLLISEPTTNLNLPLATLCKSPPLPQAISNSEFVPLNLLYKN